VAGNADPGIVEQVRQALAKGFLLMCQTHKAKLTFYSNYQLSLTKSKQD
jgi:hypothetical protein